MPARRHHPTMPPSAFPALAECPQYQSNPEVGQAAIRGTRIGATVEQVLTGQPTDEAYSIQELRYKYKEEEEEIAWAVETVRGLYPEGTADLEIEKEVILLDDNFEEVTFGTPDYYKAGHLSDLKTGQRRNYRRQMAVLSVGLMVRDGLSSMRVTLIWSKTREIEAWEWTLEEAAALVWPVVESVRAGGPARVNSYCSWCRKRETCAARVQAVNTLPVGLVESKDLGTFLGTMTPDERGNFLRTIKAARKYLEDADAAIVEWFMADPKAHAMTGYKVGTTFPKRIWENELEAGQKLRAKALEMGRDADQLWDTKLVGVTKVTKILGQAKPVKALVDSLLYTPPGEPAMVEDWGKVPAIAPGQDEPQKATIPKTAKETK
jgi:hypothetical protein